MSGGSLNYVYEKVEEAEAEIRSRNRGTLYETFADHLVLVAKALHDVEWVFSCDFSKDGADEAIRDVLAKAEIDRTLRSKLLVAARHILDELE